MRRRHNRTIRMRAARVRRGAGGQRVSVGNRSPSGWAQISLVVLVMVCGSLLSAPCALAAAADVWSPPAPMVDGARENHTSTRLPDGRVLITGGTFLDLIAYTKSAASPYDPATNAWTRAAPMSTPRYNHTATLLPDGRVLVAGGYNFDGSQGSAELYSPATNMWAPAAPMHRTRAGQTATLLPSGKVLVSGGFGGDPIFASTSELYDPATNMWSQPAAMQAIRSRGATATLVPGGKVLAAGGHDYYDNTALDSAELYDPATDEWAAVTAMSIPREEHTATLLAGGRVLVTGGSASRVSGSVIADSAELYDAATSSWTPAASMGSVRYTHAATLLASGRVLVTGGSAGEGGIIVGGSPDLASAELYDPPADAWMPAAAMHSARGQHAATLLADGRVLVSGGVNVDTSEVYGPPSSPGGAGGAPGGGTPPGTGAPTGVVPQPGQKTAPPCSGLLPRCQADRTYRAALKNCNAIKTRTRAGRKRKSTCVARARLSHKRALALARCRSIKKARTRAACVARARRIHR